jgi:hypothetical protein
MFVVIPLVLFGHEHCDSVVLMCTGLQQKYCEVVHTVHYIHISYFSNQPHNAQFYKLSYSC